jgi:3-hydroxyacyl-CoA dehydrogenase
MTTLYEVHGPVALITLSNPPVNGLGHATRLSLTDNLQKANADAAVKAIVITGAGKAFSGGADIKEFGTPKALSEPNLHSVIRVVENSAKPVVAAIHSASAWAAAWNWRWAATTASRPPAPRSPCLKSSWACCPAPAARSACRAWSGVEPALNMIVSGSPSSPNCCANPRPEAVRQDRRLARILAQEALAFANDFRHPAAAAGARPARQAPQRRRLLPVRPQHGQGHGQAFPAPLKCVDAVEAATKKKFEDGLAFERELFINLMWTPESRALRHAFMAERAASKIPDVPEDTPKREIKSVAVVGAGTMGGGIAMNFLNAGIPVTILEMKQEALDKGLGIIKQELRSPGQEGQAQAGQVRAAHGPAEHHAEL